MTVLRNLCMKRAWVCYHCSCLTDKRAKKFKKLMKYFPNIYLKTKNTHQKCLVDKTQSEQLSFFVSQLFLCNLQNCCWKFQTGCSRCTFPSQQRLFRHCDILYTLKFSQQTVRTKRRGKFSVLDGKHGSVWFPSPCRSAGGGASNTFRWILTFYWREMAQYL